MININKIFSESFRRIAVIYECTEDQLFSFFADIKIGQHFYFPYKLLGVPQNVFCSTWPKTNNFRST